MKALFFILVISLLISCGQSAKQQACEIIEKIQSCHETEKVAEIASCKEPLQEEMQTLIDNDLSSYKKKAMEISQKGVICALSVMETTNLNLKDIDNVNDLNNHPIIDKSKKCRDTELAESKKLFDCS